MARKEKQSPVELISRYGTISGAVTPRRRTVRLMAHRWAIKQQCSVLSISGFGQ